MNRYHIEVLGSAKPYKEILADFMDYSRSGCYEFKMVNLDGHIVPVAYFPIHKTCIEKIEYDINQTE